MTAEEGVASHEQGGPGDRSHHQFAPPTFSFISTPPSAVFGYARASGCHCSDAKR